MQSWLGSLPYSQSCSVVAAWACSLVSLEHTKVRIHMRMKMVKCLPSFGSNAFYEAMLLSYFTKILTEILRDRPSWFWDRRSLNFSQCFLLEMLENLNFHTHRCMRMVDVFIPSVISWVFTFALKVILIIKSASGICSNYSCSYMGFLDSRIYYNFRERGLVVCILLESFLFLLSCITIIFDIVDQHRKHRANSFHN